MPPPRVLTIAGSDSGGGAGIQADLKTFLSLGAYGLSVITALTAQNTTGVSAIHAPPSDFVRQQLQSVISDIGIDAVKVGMLCNHDIVEAVAQVLTEWKESNDRLGGRDVPVVLDPVMVSTSGSLLLSEPAIVTLIDSLLPQCTVLTPNLPEAKQLLKYAAKSSATSEARGADGSATAPPGPSNPEDYRLRQTTDISSMMEAARKLSSLGPRAVLVKGGHVKLSRREVLDQIAESSYGRPTEVIPPLVRREAVAEGRFPQRVTDRGSSPHRLSLSNRSEDLAALSGVQGAAITVAGNVAVVRTDQYPFARIFRDAKPDAPGLEEDDPVICDVLFERGAAAAVASSEADGFFTLFVKPYVSSTATHGTGCTLSSALAASLAQGQSVLRATSTGISYVQQAIACGIQDLGAGSGPLDHSFPIQPRGLIGSPLCPHPLCQSLVASSLPLWTSFTRHPFVLSLADSTLSVDKLVYFLRQDYLFLRHYARLWSLAATFSSNTFEQITYFSEVALTMGREAELHIDLCRKFGISKEELEGGTDESTATLAYTRYVESVGKSGSVLDLLVALAPCMLGYGEVGLFLGDKVAGAAAPTTPEAQGLRAWIEGYSGEEFQSGVRTAMALIERIAEQDPPSPKRLEALQKIWNAACRLEIQMWDEAVYPESRRPVLQP